MSEEKESPVVAPEYKFSEGQEVLVKGGGVGKVLKIADVDGKVTYVVSQSGTVEVKEKDLEAV